uniref:Uncharacterized protein n=1 Tax=Opuntia streptacantha TaxID=393608 RepID=A0A7C8Z6X5_OPUST
MNVDEGGVNLDPLNDTISQTSGTKTLSAGLCGYTYSEEVTKINQLLKRKTQFIQGEGFDGEANLSQNKDGQGQTGSNSSPPGFEGTVSKIGTAEEEGKSRTRKRKIRGS